MLISFWHTVNETEDKYVCLQTGLYQRLLLTEKTIILPQRPAKRQYKCIRVLITGLKIAFSNKRLEQEIHTSSEQIK